MEVSTEKSKIMVVGKGQNTENLEVKVVTDSVQLEQVRNFTYLGARIEDNGKSEREIRTELEKRLVHLRSRITSGGHRAQNEQQAVPGESNCCGNATVCVRELDDNKE